MVLTPRMGIRRVPASDFESGEHTPIPRRGERPVVKRPPSLADSAELRRLPRSTTPPTKRAMPSSSQEHFDAQWQQRLPARIGLGMCALSIGALALLPLGLGAESRIGLLLLIGITAILYGVHELALRQSGALPSRVSWMMSAYEATLPTLAYVVLARLEGLGSPDMLLPLYALVLVQVSSRLDYRITLASTLAACVSLLAVSVAVLPHAPGFDLPLSECVWLLMLGGMATLATHHITQLMQRLDQSTQHARRVEAELERFLSPDVARSILADSTDHARPARRKLSVLFCDLRGFTFLCERERPEDVVELLNTFYEGACKIIRSHGGTVNKFLGDGLLALFGAPDAHEDHAYAAAKAALEIQQLIRYLRERGGTWTHLAVGIGIDSGDVVVGPLGSQERVEYTAIGSAVNRAARLQGLAERDSRRIILSQASARAIGKRLPLRRLAQVELKGFNRAETVYSLRH